MAAVNRVENGGNFHVFPEPRVTRGQIGENPSIILNLQVERSVPDGLTLESCVKLTSMKAQSIYIRVLIKQARVGLAA